MCVGIPAKVIEIKNDQAKVEQQDHSHWVSIETLQNKTEVKVGDYLLTYLDTAINKVSDKQAQEVFALMDGTGDAGIESAD